MICPACQTDNPHTLASCAGCGRPLPVGRLLAAGSVIKERYEIEGLLGVGGMGMVFKARDRALDEDVAIKVMKGSSLRGDSADRFRLEIKLARRVRHRNVCGIHEYGEDGDLRYLSMEYVKGRDLKAIVAESGALPWKRAFDLTLQIAQGLEAIHEAGVIHRDLKLANIMCDERGVVRLMDFGIAKGWKDEDVGLTDPGQIVGSPEYMSPEQWMARRVDSRSDLYALGIVTFELFTGRVPFRGDSPLATRQKHLSDEPPLHGPEAASLPRALIPVLRRALAKDPADRPSSCREMATAVQEARASLDPESTDFIPIHVPDPTVPLRLSNAARLLVPLLIRALGSEDSEVRSGGAQALGRSGGIAAAAGVPELLRCLGGDSVADVRAESARALGLVGAGAPHVLQGLARAALDPDEAVRHAVREARARLEPPASPG